MTIGYIDWGYAGGMSVYVIVATLLIRWLGKRLADFAVSCDMQAQAAAREQGDAPDMHDMMPALQPERIARHREEMTELDEHEAERFVG